MNGPWSDSWAEAAPPSGTEFLDIAALDRIEENHLIAAVIDRLGLRAQAGGIVAAAFDGAGAADRGARVVLRHPDRHRRGSALEIGADRRGDDGEDVFRRRLHAEEDLARDHEGPQIETALAARDPGAVDAHELLDRFDEDGLGQLRHRHAVGRTLEAPCIGVGAEQVHAAVVALVGLEAFKDFLRVVQHGQGRIEREIGAEFDPRVMPALRLVVADHGHVIGENAAEAGVHELRHAVLLGGRSSRGLDREFQTAGLTRCRSDVCRRPVCPGLIQRNSHGLSPGSTRFSRLRRGAVGDAWPSTAGLAAGCHATTSFRTCFCGMRKSSMFAEMPLDNRTVKILAAVAAASGFLRPFLTAPRTRRFNISPRLTVL